MAEKTVKCYYKEGSRDGAWYKDLPVDENGKTTIPSGIPFLQEGALLRIADSLELMTKDKAEMEKENLDLRGYKAQAETQETELSVERHRCASLRGVIARLKKQAKKG